MVLHRTRQLLAAPVFADEEKMRIAGLLNITLLTVLAMTTVVTITLLTIGPGILAIQLSNILLIVLELITLWLMRRGHVQLASGILASILGVFFILITITSGGVLSPSYSSYIVVILIAALFLGGWAGIGFAGVGIVAGLGLLLSEMRGLLPAASVPATPILGWASVTATFVVAAVLLHLAMRSLNEALRRAYSSEQLLAEKNEELQVAHTQLAARAAELKTLNEQLKRDIIARKKAEEVLKTYADRLEQSNRDLEQFAYIASHDLQEPLRKVHAFGDRLVAKYEAVLDDRGRDYLARMQSAAARMQTLINDLLTYSRVTTKAQPFTPVDLTQLVREVQEDLEMRIGQVGGQVEVGALPTIEADPTQMRQLFQNLIGNGLKFHRDGIAPVVKVYSGQFNLQDDRHSTATELCQIVVEDNGIGFEEKYAERIFEVFQRLHGPGEYKGTGIGLATCRKIVERHRGWIRTKSIPGRGATFILTLPIRHSKGEI